MDSTVSTPPDFYRWYTRLMSVPNPSPQERQWINCILESESPTERRTLDRQPYSPRTVQRHLEAMDTKLLEQARLLTPDQCDFDQESVISLSRSCRHGDGCVKCIVCSKCQWAIFDHRRLHPPRNSRGVLMHEKLQMPFLRLTYPLWGNLLVNNEHLRTRDEDIQLNLVYYLQAQLERADSEDLGEGGFAIVRVYRNVFVDESEDLPMTGVEFAVKYEKEEKEIERSLHEATMLVMCETINNLRVPFLLGLAYNDVTEQIGLVIHRIKGITLYDLCVNPTSHSIAVKVGIFTEIVKTLAVLHHHRIYHQDLKSDNIIISANHLPYIIDFGLAEMRDPAEDVTVGQILDVTSLFTVLGELFPPVKSRSTSSSSDTPPCIVTAYRKLKTFVYEDVSVTAAELRDLLHRCACGQHPKSIPASTIQQGHKLKLATVARMCTAEITCDQCVVAGKISTARPHYLLSPATAVPETIGQKTNESTALRLARDEKEDEQAEGGGEAEEIIDV